MTDITEIDSARLRGIVIGMADALSEYAEISYPSAVYAMQQVCTAILAGYDKDATAKLLALMAARHTDGPAITPEFYDKATAPLFDRICAAADRAERPTIN